jgi:hypothetical protein
MAEATKGGKDSLFANWQFSVAAFDPFSVLLWLSALKQEDCEQVTVLTNVSTDCALVENGLVSASKSAATTLILEHIGAGLNCRFKLLGEFRV